MKHQKRQWIAEVLLMSLFLGGIASCVPSPKEATPKANKPPEVTTDSEPAAASENSDASTATNVDEGTSATDEAATAQAEEVEVSDEPVACDAGIIAGLNEYLRAELVESTGQSTIPISPWIGAAPGQSYGIAGEEVEIVASALDAQCDRWVWVKWPESGFKGWLRLANISEQEIGSFAGIGNTLTSLKCEDYNSSVVIGLSEYEAYALKNEKDQIAISPWFGAPPSESYGIPGEKVIVIASAFEEDCTQWLLTQWESSGFRGWIPANDVVTTSDK